MTSNHFILCHPLLLLPSIFPSIRVFSNESVLCVSWPKYWNFSCSISPSSEYSGLISFRIDWVALLAVQRCLKSLLQHHSSKASVLQHSAYFIVHRSHPYMTTGKTTALTRWTFVGKVMSLLFHMLSSLVITFLPRSKHLLISWLQFIIGDWNAKVGSQETPGVTGKFGLGIRNDAGQRLIVLPRERTGHSKHPLPTTQEKTVYMDITRWSTPKSE